MVVIVHLRRTDTILTEDLIDGASPGRSGGAQEEGPDEMGGDCQCGLIASQGKKN